MALLNQDLSTYESQDNDFSPLPPGTYEVIVTDTDVKDTKSGKKMVVVEMTVSGAQYNGRKLWDNFVIGHPIAMSRLKTLAYVAGHSTPDFLKDSEELHGLRLSVTVKTEDSQEFGPKNKITSFKKSSVAPATIPAPKVSAPIPAAIGQKNGVKMPWDK